MNILVDPLPSTVHIVGREYKIRTDFRISILFELMMQDNNINAGEKVYKALNLYYPDIPEDKEPAINAALWFYKCGKDETPQKKHMAARRGQAMVYSFEHDADYIYAAFMTQYRIDLQNIKYMHWWKFRAMFNSLTDRNEFVKIMGYRSIDLKENMPKEQKSFYRKMKRLHALPVSVDEDERSNAIEEALLNGGDLTGIV